MRFLNKILFVQLLVFTVQCRPVSNESEGKVVGGTEDYATFPAAIGLHVYFEKVTGRCTGTVVTDDLVMTAAHCVSKPGAGRVKSVDIFVKESDVVSPPSFGPKSLSSSDFIVHPNHVPWDTKPDSFVEAIASDIAFIRFTKGALVGFAKASLAKATPEVGDQVTIVGYGRDQIGLSGAGGKRHIGRSKIAVLDTESQGSAIVVTSKPMFDENKKLSHFPAIINIGDSGGPLFDALGAVIGVASLANTMDKGLDEYASFYVNLFHPQVAAFVQQQLASSLKSASPQVPATQSPSNVSQQPEKVYASQVASEAPPSKVATKVAEAPQAKTSTDDGLWHDAFNGKVFAYCASRVSDPDGDGWGYENGASCKVRT